MTSSRLILASDLDGTLIAPPGAGDGGAREAFRDAVAARDGVVLAYVTGRHLRLAEQGIREAGLPSPDFVACDVGTSLYGRGKAGFDLDVEYRERMLAAMGGLRADDVRAIVSEVPGVELQEPAKQAEFKASVYTPPGAEGSEVVARVEQRLSGRGAAVTFVWSVDPATGRGLLDVLPGGVAKHTAIRHLARRHGVGPDAVVYAGDSGNDRAALLAGFRGVLVGNARPELVEELRAEVASRGLEARVYFADAPFAGGVLEGWRHFGVL